MALRRIRRPRSRFAAIAIGLIAAGVATGILVSSRVSSSTIAASVYMFATVLGAATGGAGAAVSGSILSFVGLNYFFTPPLHTLTVAKVEDLVALIIFLPVALGASSLVSWALSEQDRARSREEQARALQSLTSRVLSGERVDTVLDAFARTTLELFELARVEVIAGDRPPTLAQNGNGKLGSSMSVPLRSGNHAFGTVDVARAAGAPAFTGEERLILEAFAGQAATALERARLDATAQDARLDAEANRLRAALFSSVTHDLRTPLASIKASVTSLLGDDVAFAPEARTELLHTILEETDRMNRLVTNLLDLARLRTGALVPSRQLTPIEDVIESVVARLRPTLGRRTIDVNLRPDLPAAWLDPVQLDQALTNIVENAIRYTPEDSAINIGATAWHSAIQLRVTDEGPGIPVENRDKVFEAFWRGDGHGPGGTGLGLAIAHAIATGHGGRIWVEATPRGGTTIVVQIPVNPPSNTVDPLVTA